MSWPTRRGTNRGGSWRRDPGPLKGSVGSRWVPPERERAEFAIIAEDGRVAIPAGKSVHLLAPDLRPLETCELGTYVRDVVATSRGFIAAAGGLHGLGGVTLPAGLSAPWFQWGPHGVRELADGTLLVWDGSDFVRISPDGKELARYRTESTMSATRAVAVSFDGTIWSCMAMSWSSEDDPTEYYACLAAFDPGGTKRGEWSHDVGLPTSIGSDVRVCAIDGGVVLSDSGAAIVRVGAPAPEWVESMNTISVPEEGTVVFGASGQSVQQAHLKGASSITRLASLGEEWIKDVVTDGAGHVYVATGRGVVGLRADGSELFRVEPFPARALSLGEGYLLAVSADPGGGVIRIH